MVYQNNSMSKEDWSQKDKRDLFCKAVNSMLMTNPDTDLNKVLKDALKIVNTAFNNYPDSNDSGQKLEEVIK